jgi:glyoxylase-like metal-dependent hydrolase (beta-lactamase superfamily II)/rhodanese-related sulfurtransferase
MILQQYFLGCLAHASYLIVDEETKTAAVVDPQRDVEGYVADAAGLGVQIRHVVLTHFHGDFVAGHLELRDRVGAQIYLGARAEAEYPFTRLKEGDTLEFGSVRLHILETPGHTPEGVCIVVYDLSRDRQRPYAVLTGDTLFIGDVGRPDLMASMGMTAEELGGLLYDSLHDKLLTLPDETLVYPAHGAGSMCGKNLSTDRRSTIGEQRKYNYALQPMSREQFIELITADQPEAPEYFSYDALLNRRERATLEQSLARALASLTLDDVLQRQAAGAQIVDARDPADFAGAHLANTLNIGLGGRYASWAGTLLHRSRPIVIVAEPGREKEAALRLGRIGFDHVVGYLEGGMQALDGHPDRVRRTERLTAATLAEHLTAPDPPVVVDVRTRAEWTDRRIGGSRNVPLNHLRADAAELPRDRTLVVYCQTGYRSAIAASILEQEGFTRVMDLVGGFVAWEQQTAVATSRA